MSEQKIIGAMRGRIVGTGLKIVGNNRTPLVEIFFRVEDGTVPFKLWVTPNVYKGGYNKGKSGVEVTEQTLRKLTFQGSSIADLQDRSIEENFSKTEFDVNVIWQVDKDGEVSDKYREVSYVGLELDLPKLSSNEIKGSFRNLDALLRNSGTTKREESFDGNSDEIPF